MVFENLAMLLRLAGSFAFRSVTSSFAFRSVIDDATECDKEPRHSVAPTQNSARLLACDAPLPLVLCATKYALGPSVEEEIISEAGLGVRVQ